MASDVMSVRLWLPRIKVEGVVVDAPEELVVRVCSTVRRPRCPDCGVPSGKVHDRRDNKIRDLEVSGRPVTLIWERRRLVCEPCGSRFSEGHQGFEGRVTARLARRLVKDARAMTVNAAAKRHQVSWKLVNSLVVAWAGLVGEHRRRQRCRVLLVDETSIRKRHRYVTVIVNGDTGEVLAMVPHRDTQALSGFLAAQGPRWCKAVKVVVSDGSKAYKAAIDKRLGHARHVLDRFHVIRWFAAGLTAVRRDVQRRPEGLSARVRPRRVQVQVLADAPTRQARSGRTGTPRRVVRRPSAAQSSLGSARRAAQPLSRRPTARAPSRRSTGSLTSTAPATSPSSAASSTRSWRGTTRYSTGTTPGGPATAASKAPTTCSKSCDAEPTASPTTPTSKPAVSY